MGGGKRGRNENNNWEDFNARMGEEGGRIEGLKVKRER